ncbi:MAG: acylneuraminate cytidylyltransferase family protein [Chloroflexota bacterium]|nr:acylneuraminate cytidylyltransferase family protein [Chloroflexota bacterium]
MSATTPTVLGLITARGGSKSIPRKNIAQVGGKPLIAWTIGAAFESYSLSRVIVSTDDAEIAQVSREWGAEVPFMRPAELAQENSPHMDVVVHAVEWLMTHKDYCPDYVMLLQPTSPLRTAEDIDAAVALAAQRNVDRVASVSESPAHPYLIKQITEEGNLVDFVDKPEGYLPRQSFPSVYVVNGAIYLGRRKALLRERTWYTNRTYPYIMPPEHSLDVDTPWDLYLADLILKDRMKHEGN